MLTAFSVVGSERHNAANPAAPDAELVTGPTLA
jgi:hypothetical protein